MPIAWEVDPARSLVLMTATGDVTMADWLQARREYGGDPAMLACRRFLVDLRQAAMALRGDEVRALSGTRRELPFVTPESRTAVVVANPLAYGLSRMYELTRKDDGRFRVFDDYDQALRWIEEADEFPDDEP